MVGVERGYMGSLAKVPASGLTALTFADRQNFYAATDIVAEQRVVVDIPGGFALIVKKTDRHRFAHLSFTEHRVRNA